MGGGGGGGGGAEQNIKYCFKPEKKNMKEQHLQNYIPCKHNQLLVRHLMVRLTLCQALERHPLRFQMGAAESGCTLYDMSTALQHS